MARYHTTPVIVPVSLDHEKSWSWSIQSFGYLTQANMSDLCPTLQMYVTICFEVFLENYDGQIANRFVMIRSLPQTRNPG